MQPWLTNIFSQEDIDAALDRLQAGDGDGNAAPPPDEPAPGQPAAGAPDPLLGGPPDASDIPDASG